MAAMKEASVVQKEQMKKLNLDDMEDLMDDMQDLMADQEEINEMMAMNFGVDFDESELQAELDELDEEAIGEMFDEGLGVPSYIPQGQKVDSGAKADAV